jgi:serine/threonine protein kinase, bacterial
MKAVLLNNRYRILETLGRGGFGETYLAEDTHMPSGRKCVLKQLKPIVETPQIPLWMKSRFQREAAILEELGAGNPQIPQLFAYFSEEGKFYLVQEFIEGVTLDKYWEKEGNLHREEVRQILIKLLPVLDYIHSRNIIHRDLKPENIILRSIDRLPVLIDFGAVKEAMATTNSGSSSMYSAAIGTPGYMSSEQAAGRPVYSSDLYSLGLTAIFLLTGKTPQDLTPDPNTGEIIWRQYAENVDENLLNVLDRSIRFHPRDRFTTARAMLTALDASATQQRTVATMRVAPAANKPGNSIALGTKTNTVAVDVPYEPQARKKSNWLVNLFLFLLIASGLSIGAFFGSFALIANLWRSRPQPQATIETPRKKPVLFPPQEESKTELPTTPTTEEDRSENKKNNEPETETKDPTTETPPPEISLDKPAKPESTEVPVQSQPKTNTPLITTGSSESQLVSSLGQPTSQRQDWRENSRILVYQNVGDTESLSYRSDSQGQIRQTDVALNQNVSLGAMQNTLDELLGGTAPSAVKEKLRQVYDRKTNLSFFKVDRLEGKVQRDSKDRINISVWEEGYQ